MIGFIYLFKFAKTSILNYGAGNLGSVFKFFKLFDSLEVEIRDNLNNLEKITDNSRVGLIWLSEIKILNAFI